MGDFMQFIASTLEKERKNQPTNKPLNQNKQTKENPPQPQNYFTWKKLFFL